MLGSTGLGTQTLGWDEVAMERALRIAGETGVFIAVSALYLWPGLPRTIATSLAILLVVEDQQRRGHLAGRRRHIQLLPSQTKARLEAALHARADIGGNPQRLCEPARVGSRIGRRRDEDGPLDLEAPAHGHRRRGAAHRMRHHGSWSVDLSGHGEERLDELGERREPSRGLAVTRSVEHHGRPARGEDRFDKRVQPHAAASPAVHEKDRRALPPRPDGDAPGSRRPVDSQCA